jgi:hypothetical protein
MFASKTKWKRFSAVARSANVTDIGAINRCWTDASCEREALTPSVTQRCTIDADDGAAAAAAAERAILRSE